jgi:hypothetical protein
MIQNRMRAQTVSGVRVAALVVLGGLPASLASANTNTLIAAVGAALPGGGTLGGFTSNPAVNASGQVAYTGFISGAPATIGVFLRDGATTNAVARSGDPTPLGGSFGTGFNAPAIDGTGRVFFVAGISGGSSTSAVLSWMNGSAQSIAARNDPAPGGGTFNNISGISAAGNGRFSFASTLNNSTNSGVYTGQSGGALSRVALSGEAAPGGGTYAGTATSSVNASGGVAFNFSGSGLYLRTNSVTTAIAKIGSATTLGGTFSSISGQSLGDGNAVAFSASINAGSATGAAFVSSGGVVRTLAAVGQAATGLAGLTIAEISTPKVNSNGMAFFRVRLAGIGVNDANDTAYFTSSGNGDLQLFAREGDSVFVGGVGKTITGSLSANFFTVGAEGVAWRVQLDGVESILYTADARFAIPSPGGAVLLALGGLVVARRRR